MPCTTVILDAPTPAVPTPAAPTPAAPVGATVAVRTWRELIKILADLGTRA